MSRWRELTAVLVVSGLLTAVMTYPLAFRLGSVGRVDNADGQLSIWNVAWVARTLVTDPLHVLDANIFHPHRRTLSYSEANLGAGALAVPAYWLSDGNPYTAHNSVVLLSFVLSAAGMYYLARYLTRDRRAAAVAAVCFAFSPYLFAHTSHIQLLMTAGLPFSLLAFHRMADRPTPARGAVVGGVMAAQAICCGYYGVFAVLTVGFASLVVAAMGRRWSDRQYWTALVTAALVAIVLVTPLFLPYASLQREVGFRRPLDAARPYAANWSAYAASASYAHRWMLRHLPPWREVLFPGVVATILGGAGVWLGRRMRAGEVSVLYAGLAALAFWASFGPAGGLYNLLYRAIPVFTLMRAPARFGLLVAFGLSVLAGAAVAVLVTRWRHATAAGVAVAMLAATELAVPLNFPPAPAIEPVHRTLATLPRGAVIEMPFYYPEVGLHQHAKYMLESTSHWMPLVNGYSDHIPLDFYENVMTLATFPSRAALKILEPHGVRYAVFHLYGYNTANRNDVLTRIEEFAAYLRPLHVDEYARLYEIVGFPP